MGRQSEVPEAGGGERPPPARYRVGDLEVDLGRQQVWRAGTEIALPKLSFDLLVALIGASPNVASLDALLSEVWRDVTVNAETVSQRVRLLRDALGDDARAPRYVAGVRGRGYRLLPSVARILAPDVPQAAANDAAGRGRAAVERHDWEVGYQLLYAADRERPLGPADLELLAWAAFWTARYGEAIQHFERAEVGYLREHDTRSGARVTLLQARLHFDQRNDAVGAGLWARGQRLLKDVPECAEHGRMLAWSAAGALGRGDIPLARKLAQRACEVGRRVGDRDSEALGLLFLGRACLSEGLTREGIAYCDEAAAAATSSELSVFVAGWIYCAAVVEHRMRADWQRAAEWADRATRWCERESVAFFPGMCLVHRGEIRRFRGDFSGAERDVLRGCELMMPASPILAAQGFRELAEIRLRRGDLDGAEDACRECIRRGREPQPALALLHLARGDAALALASIDRALGDPSLWHRQNRMHLLPAKVSIAIAAQETEAAADALTELDSLAAQLGTPAPSAAAALARGEVELGVGRAREAIPHLRRAVLSWSELGAPHEAARAQLVLATALDRALDARAAEMERSSALQSFEQLGATLDAQRARAERESVTKRPRG